jgi:hypothetical protein
MSGGIWSGLQPAFPAPFDAPARRAQGEGPGSSADIKACSGLKLHGKAR